MRDLVITLMVFGTLPFVLARPYIGVLLFSWISYMNPHRMSWGFAYNFPFAAVAAAATLIGLVFSKEPKRFPIKAVTIFWLLFVLWTCITTWFAFNPDDAFMEWKRSIKIQIMIFVTLLLINNRERLHQLLWVIVGSFAFFGVKGGVFTIATGGNYRVWGPPGSFVEGNNELALALVMILPLMRYFQVKAQQKWMKGALLGGMILCGFSILSSYSRGAFLATAAMILMLWLKGRGKVISGIILVMLVTLGLTFMPSQWFNRMETIESYQQDASAMGRINAWTFAYNLANDRPLIGGGFGAFDPRLFQKYAPVPEDFHDAHSIYFEILGEQGYIGLILFLTLWFTAFRTATWVTKSTSGHENLSWAKDLTAMIQVSLVGYAVGGAFLGLAYFDLPYHLMAILVLTRTVVENELEDEKPVGSRRFIYTSP